VRAAFCLEQCEHGPNVVVDGECVHHSTAENTIALIDSRIESDTRNGS
jgi:NADH:ubiquinone oxidoreductase subunit E